MFGANTQNFTMKLTIIVIQLTSYITVGYKGYMVTKQPKNDLPNAN